MSTVLSRSLGFLRVLLLVDSEGPVSRSGVLFAVAAGAGLLLFGEDMRAAQWLAIGLVILACAGSARGSRTTALGMCRNGGVQRGRQNHLGFPDVSMAHLFPSPLPTGIMTRQNAFRP